MTVQIACPWCLDEVAFTVDDAADELVCSSCAMRTDFAPDPLTTYAILYAQVAA